MDIAFGPDQDILSDTGFCNMMYQVLNLKPGAAMWAAPVCSSWVFVKLGIRSFPESNFVILHMDNHPSNQNLRCLNPQRKPPRRKGLFFVFWQCQTNTKITILEELFVSYKSTA